ncbi:TPA: integrase core domain-containing protein, partial [Klebsiella pneumoniae]
FRLMATYGGQFTLTHNLAVAIEHYNENHPHSALGYRSPREYRRQWVTLT